MSTPTVKNIKFKPSYVMNFNTNVNGIRFTKNVEKVIEVMKRDGLKCHCCEESSVFFKVIDNDYMAAFVDRDGQHVRLTLDHDHLDSMGGSDTIDNFHVLCEQCNLLRDDRFAEYSTFKSWYDEKKSSGKKICKPNMRNYSRIDFEYMIKHRLSEINFSAGVPAPMKIQLRKYVLSHNKLSGRYTASALKRISSKHMNNFLSKLVHEIAAKRTNSDILTNISTLNFYPKVTKGTTSKEFLDKLDNNFKMHLKNTVKMYSSSEVQQKVLNVHTSRTGIWTRITEAFKILFC
ncbi:HNH endonuclease [Serratia phage BF]|uniref:HNH endonuclease n=1 Tax=Serratia phage BF TaxID=1962671 RepID=A0A1S6UBI7_9CAUD|nr:HNH endonuclease [Serratia phage BF]AQW89054.1 HNH endonuclease [Serratia phage BF]